MSLFTGCVLCPELVYDSIDEVLLMHECKIVGFKFTIQVFLCVCVYNLLAKGLLQS